MNNVGNLPPPSLLKRNDYFNYEFSIPGKISLFAGGTKGPKAAFIAFFITEVAYRMLELSALKFPPSITKPFWEQMKIRGVSPESVKTTMGSVSIVAGLFPTLGWRSVVTSFPILETVMDGAIKEAVVFQFEKSWEEVQPKLEKKITDFISSSPGK